MFEYFRYFTAQLVSLTMTFASALAVVSVLELIKSARLCTSKHIYAMPCSSICIINHDIRMAYYYACI